MHVPSDHPQIVFRQVCGDGLEDLRGHDEEAIPPLDEPQKRSPRIAQRHQPRLHQSHQETVSTEGGVRVAVPGAENQILAHAVVHEQREVFLLREKGGVHRENVRRVFRLVILIIISLFLATRVDHYGRVAEPR